MNIFHHCVTNIFTNKTGSHLLYIPSLKHYHWITCSHPDSRWNRIVLFPLIFYCWIIFGSKKLHQRNLNEAMKGPLRNGAFTVKSGISIVPKLSSRLRPRGRTHPYAGDTTLWIRILCSSRGHNARYSSLRYNTAHKHYTSLLYKYFFCCSAALFTSTVAINLGPPLMIRRIWTVEIYGIVHGAHFDLECGRRWSGR
jgi:hypothetical protein